MFRWEITNFNTGRWERRALKTLQWWWASWCYNPAWLDEIIPTFSILAYTIKVFSCLCTRLLQSHLLLREQLQVVVKSHPDVMGPPLVLPPPHFYPSLIDPIQVWCSLLLLSRELPQDAVTALFELHLFPWSLVFWKTLSTCGKTPKYGKILSALHLVAWDTS